MIDISIKDYSSASREMSTPFPTRDLCKEEDAFIHAIEPVGRYRR